MNCLNPAAIILGGELGTAGEPLVSGVRESIDRYAQPASALAVDVRTGQLGINAELFGALATAAGATAPRPPGVFRSVPSGNSAPPGKVMWPVPS